MSQQISSTLQSKIILEKYKKKGIHIYNFGLGENPIEQPEYFIEMIKKYANKKHYTQYDGIPELNKTLKNIYNTNNTKYEILVGNGLKELLFILQLAFEGTIVHITPSWVSYKEQIDALNKNDDLILFETHMNDNYRIDLNKFEKMLQYKNNSPKLLFFNNPNNPTGYAYSNNEIELLANIIKKYNCFVFSDEIYLNLCYEQNIHSISRYIPELTIRGTSVSKDLGCGGYRLGWLAFPETMTSFYNKCAKLSSNIYSCASVPIQYATNFMLLNKEDHKNHYIQSSIIYKYISNEICSLLQNSKLNFVKPNAAWYILINFDNYKQELNFLHIFNGNDLSVFLLDKLNILTVAGDAFNINGLNLRFSFIDFKYNIYQKNDINISNMLEGINKLVEYFHTLHKLYIVK